MKYLTRKILTVCTLVALVSVFINLITPSSAFAVNGFHGDCRNLLGLTSWDCGVDIETSEDLKNNLWTIVVNIANDITIVAAYLVLGYVIYGGYLYITSSGDPSKVATGKKTLTRAFIGLAIIMSANVIMGAVRIALIGGNGNFGSCDVATGSGCVDANTMVTNLIQWVIGMAGIVAAIFVVYGGISYATSSGDPSKLQKAKQIILYALIGLAIVALAEIITAFVSSTIRNANAFVNQTTISKEITIHETKVN